MRTRLFAVALTVCIPSLVFAQKKGAGGDPSSPAPMASSPSSSGPKLPSARDLQDLNPASLLVDKKKKASLPDSTVAQLKAVEKKINERNAQFFATYDSLHKFTRSLSADNGPSGGSQMLRGGQADAKITAGGASPAEQAQAQAAATRSAQNDGRISRPSQHGCRRGARRGSRGAEESRDRPARFAERRTR